MDNNSDYPQFTDIHSHIIPGIDDGCRNLDESYGLIESSLNNNVKNIILTPHFIWNDNHIKRVELKEKIKAVKEIIKMKRADIKVYPGMEVRASFEVPEIIKSKDYLTTLLDKKKYILLELPFSQVPYKLSEILFKIKLLGIVPILAHPERYEYFRNKLKYLEELHDEGTLMQANNSSLVKNWKSPTYRRAVKMLKSGIIENSSFKYLTEVIEHLYLWFPNPIMGIIYNLL